MIQGSCHCGAVQLEVETAPEEVTDCGCSICRRKAGLWAYYSPRQVKVSGPTSIYIWGDRMIEHHSCPVCACTTHWTAVDKTYDRMGVNIRMMEPEVLARARVRRTEGPS